MKEVVHFIYNEQSIDFLPSGENVMVNATQMAEIFGKQVNEFTSNKNTQSFINECLKNGNSRFLGIKNQSDLIDSKQKSGTWMHRILALKFAAWLDPKFELWVFITIDQILLGHYKEQKEATTAKILAERELELKKNELLEKYPEFIDFLKIEGKISDAEKRRLKAIRDSVKQLKLDLFEQVVN
ncbi:MAG: KilA-N domain-containing protein [Bacteroidales bacterium]|nr:KilA-N domain-containing protein [Bacteroidales bacterium]